MDLALQTLLVYSANDMAYVLAEGANVTCLVRDWVPRSRLVSEGLLDRTNVVRGELEDEALAKILAQEKGITVSDEETSAEIAAQLGVPAGGAGSTFDTLYRQRLTTVKMSDGAYRRYTEAQVYINKLKAKLAEEIGNTGEVVTLRAVVLASKEDADKVLARVNTGENLGSVAQAASTDISSRQNDGLMEPTPTRMLPDAVRAAIDGKSAGSDLIGPLEVAGNPAVIARLFSLPPLSAKEAAVVAQTLAELAPDLPKPAEDATIHLRVVDAPLRADPHLDAEEVPHPALEHPAERVERGLPAVQAHRQVVALVALPVVVRVVRRGHVELAGAAHFADARIPLGEGQPGRWRRVGRRWGRRRLFGGGETF